MDCKWITQCAMHKKIEEVKADVNKLIDDCGPEWTGQRRLDLLKLQRNHYRKIRTRLMGGVWAGSKPGEIDESLRDFADQFRPIKNPHYHHVDAAGAVVCPPALNSTGSERLDATLRDMTGIPHSRLHRLTLTKPVGNVLKDPPKGAEFSRQGSWKNKRNIRRGRSNKLGAKAQATM